MDNFTACGLCKVYLHPLYLTGSGLGRLLSVEFAKLGCNVVLWDINKAGNEETSALVREVGATVHDYVCDLSKREDIYRVADKVSLSIAELRL